MMPKLSRVCEVHLMKIKLFFCFSLFNEHLSFDQVLEMLSINLADDSAWNRGDKMHTTIKSFLVSHVILHVLSDFLFSDHAAILSFVFQQHISTQVGALCSVFHANHTGFYYRGMSLQEDFNLSR